MDATGMINADTIGNVHNRRIHLEWCGYLYNRLYSVTHLTLLHYPLLWVALGCH